MSILPSYGDEAVLFAAPPRVLKKPRLGKRGGVWVVLNWTPRFYGDWEKAWKHAAKLNFLDHCDRCYADGFSKIDFEKLFKE